jgi:hypothetical protein
MRGSSLFQLGGLVMIGNALYAVIMMTAAAPTTMAVLNDESFGRWRDFIRPTAAECRWQEIPWRASFWEGVVEAQKKDQPVLVWAMNGHPLACT